MHRLEKSSNFNELTFFQKIKHIKSLYCQRVIIKLDKVINFCADKEELESVKKEVEEVNNLKEISKVFNDNKEMLREYIQKLEWENSEKIRIINTLFINFNKKEYTEMKKIFSELGFKFDIKFEKD